MRISSTERLMTVLRFSATTEYEPGTVFSLLSQSFADMAAHGFNTATVPNCPEDLWEPLLASAQEHGIKIVLEVG